MRDRGQAGRMAVFSLVSTVGGVINGLLGAGGGVILMYLFRYTMKKDGAEGESLRDTFAAVVATVMPLSAITAVSYAAGGRLDTAELQVLILPALLGGVTGALLTDKLPAAAVRAVFSLLLVVSGIRMALF